MELNKIYNVDCLEFMRTLPDKCFDLVLTDPPYGLGDRLGNGGGKNKNMKSRLLYVESDWDDELPANEIFEQIFRISKNQIICGGNYFSLPPSRCFISWDKLQYMPTFSACEYIWTSFDKPAKIMKHTSTDPNRVHPTQKPIQLMAEIILKFSKEGETVFDPFMGSGTTAIACLKTNRNFIGCEISPKYCDIANKRIKEFTDQQDLFKEVI
jgi:site-specific DNA-methyltransferase (adenine-specific)